LTSGDGFNKKKVSLQTAPVRQPRKRIKKDQLLKLIYKPFVFLFETLSFDGV